MYILISKHHKSCNLNWNNEDSETPRIYNVDDIRQGIRGDITLLNIRR